MTDKPTLMQFPCDFPLKIIGSNKDSFATEMSHIIQKHFPNTPDSSIRSQPSQQNNYLAITAIVHVLNQPSLDALYQELTQHPDIKMVL